MEYKPRFALLSCLKLVADFQEQQGVARMKLCVIREGKSPIPVFRYATYGLPVTNEKLLYV